MSDARRSDMKMKEERRRADTRLSASAGNAQLPYEYVTSSPVAHRPACEAVQESSSPTVSKEIQIR